MAGHRGRRRAAPRSAPGPEVDDSSWPEVSVPGHWRSHPKLRHERRADPLPHGVRRCRRHRRGQRRWITFDGVFYQADVWLDGAYLGDPEGYFFPHSFDITALSKLGDEHVLAVEVACNPERGTTGRRNITGLFQHSEAVDHDWNPGGLWRSVLVLRHRPVRSSTACACSAATPTRSAPTCDSTPGSTRRSPAPSASARPPTGWSSARPSTRWPPERTTSSGRSTSTARRCGGRARSADQPLTDIDVELLVDGEVSDRRSRRTGLREVALPTGSLDQRRAAVPQGRQPAAHPPGPRRRHAGARSAGDVELALEAGLDALRVQAHIAGDALYDAADELGLLLLQDFPLQWGYARSVRREAVRQAREAVDALGHHPSIIQWCAHDEPVADAPQVDGDPTGDGCAGSSPAAADVEQVGARPLGEAGVRTGRPDPPDESPTAASLPHLPQLDGTDSHLWLGWHRGEWATWPSGPRAGPRLVRFVSEFGAQSVPDRRRRFVDASAWPDLDWERSREHHGLEVDVMRQRHPPSDYPTFAAWRTATQRYQADAAAPAHRDAAPAQVPARPAGSASPGSPTPRR